MTISLKVSVNGNYRATVKHDVDGDVQPDIVIEGQAGDGPVEKSITFQHGKTNTYSVTEEYMGDKAAESA